jgi:hypothetical protein
VREEQTMPEGTPNPNPNPNPDPNAEVAKPDQKDEWIVKLKSEAATRRKEADGYKRELDEQKKKFEMIFERLGASSDEEAEKALSEYRAAQSKKADPNLDPTALLQRANKLDSEFKKLSNEYKSTADERDAWRQRYQEKEIGLAIKSVLAEFGVKPAYHGALTLDIMKNVRLNDKYEAVYVTRDKDGDEVFEVSVKAGLEDYFKANPDWLPASGTPGGGSTQSKSVPAGRIDLKKSLSTLEEYEKIRPQLLDNSSR